MVKRHDDPTEDRRHPTRPTPTGTLVTMPHADVRVRWGAVHLRSIGTSPADHQWATMSAEAMPCASLLGACARSMRSASADSRRSRRRSSIVSKAPGCVVDHVQPHPAFPCTSLYVDEHALEWMAFDAPWREHDHRVPTLRSRTPGAVNCVDGELERRGGDGLGERSDERSSGGRSTRSSCSWATAKAIQSSSASGPASSRPTLRAALGTPASPDKRPGDQQHHQEGSDEREAASRRAQRCAHEYEHDKRWPSDAPHPVPN